VNASSELSGFATLPDALEWLDRHINLETDATVRTLPPIDTTTELLGLLGDPHRGYPSIHVTGTNGKGSTTAMIAAVLEARGLRVGTYTSPNLARVNERLAISAEPVADDVLRDLLATLAALEPMLSERPTRFALLTVAALCWFADEAVDVAVVEVGLGGTWDNTNVVDGDVAVITNIAYDHTHILGPSLAGIARDKAGIAKPGSRVVVGETASELVEVIAEVANGVGACEIWERGVEFDLQANSLAVGGRLIDVRTPGATYEGLLVPLHGAHQGANAAVALAAVEAFFAAPLDADVVAAGLAAVRVPGRLEVIGRRPLVVVDVAHNEAGMAALGAALDETFTVDGPKIAVVGLLRGEGGHDPETMLAGLQRGGVATVFAALPDSPRALDPEVVVAAARARGMEAVETSGTDAALGAARARAGADGLVVVAGTFSVVTAARELAATLA
jgi:dihydrofolate synthase / folylpolyglutamate synthase